METVHLRTAGAEDAINITTLLASVNDWPGFEHAGTIEDYWKWKYLQNPLGFTNAMVAVEQERIISHAASLPAEVKIGGEVRLCAQLSDLYTDQNRRGRGMMERVTSALFAADAERGIEIEMAFPSPAGYEITMKAGFAEMPVRIGHYELIVNPSRFFQNVRFGKLKKVAYEGMRMVRGRGGAEREAIDVIESPSFPSDIEQLTSAFEDRFDFIFRRDDKYLRWRYEHPEGGMFRMFLSSQAGRTTGYVVLRPYFVDGARYVDIIDLVVMPDDVPSLHALIDRCVDVSAQEEADTLQIWLPTDHPFLPELGRKGFLQRQPLQGERRMRLMARALSTDAALRNMADTNYRYHLVLGDTDWV